MEQREETNLAKRIKSDKAKARHKRRFRYSFLTIILLVCLIQMSISALLNFTKVVAYRSKIAKLESKQIAAEARNAELKKDIKNFSTTATMESIARNNLKMAGKDEVLVIVNKKEVPENNKKRGKIRLKNDEKLND
jgi:cell division protein FtsB